MAFDAEIKAFLGAAFPGVGIYQSENAALPAQQDPPFLSLIETSGPGDVRTHDRLVNPYERPTMQITARGTDGAAARALARSARRALRVVRNADLSGTFYLWIRPRGDLIDLGLDKAQRARWAFNIEAMKTDS